MATGEDRSIAKSDRSGSVEGQKEVLSVVSSQGHTSPKGSTNNGVHRNTDGRNEGETCLFPRASPDSTATIIIEEL